MVLNKDEIDSVAKATTEIIKAVPVYEDAVQPVAKEIGKALKTLGGAINVALLPLETMVYGYNIIKVELENRLETRLKRVLPENIIAPPLQVVGPLLEKYKYVHNNRELSQMFVSLLANAMDKDRVQNAHPSFVNIISELSPDEAKLVDTIHKEELLPKLDVRLKMKGENKEGYMTVITNFTLLGEKAELQYPELTPSYLSNLERLMIIQCSSGSFQEHYIEKEIYRPLLESPKIKNLNEKTACEVLEGTIWITDFGKMFMNAVL